MLAPTDKGEIEGKSELYGNKSQKTLLCRFIEGKLRAGFVFGGSAAV